MGSDFSAQICCGSCKKQEEANEETSETKPILQAPGDTPIRTDTQPFTPALEASVSQLQNLEEREKARNAEEERKPVPHAPEAQLVMHTAWDVKPVADTEQPGAGSEDGPCAGVTPQEGNICEALHITGETAAGRDCDIKPPTETGESLPVRNLLHELLHRVQQEAAEQTDRARGAEGSAQPPWSVKVTSPIETTPLMNVLATEETNTTVDPSEAIGNGVAGMQSASAMPQETPCPEWGSLELLSFLGCLPHEILLGEPAAREVQSPSCAESSEPSEESAELSDRDQTVLGDLVEGEESGESDPETAAGEAEPQQRIMQETAQLPWEPPACTQMPAKEENEFFNVAPLLCEVLGSEGEIEAENAEA